jgi:hypothetical protein
MLSLPWIAGNPIVPGGCHCSKCTFRRRGGKGRCQSCLNCRHVSTLTWNPHPRRHCLPGPTGELHLNLSFYENGHCRRLWNHDSRVPSALLAQVCSSSQLSPSRLAGRLIWPIGNSIETLGIRTAGFHSRHFNLLISSSRECHLSTNALNERTFYAKKANGTYFRMRHLSCVICPRTGGRPFSKSMQPSSILTALASELPPACQVNSQ